MGNIKSIVDIDVKSEKFQKFKALFDAYNIALGKQSGMWGKVGAAQSDIGKGFQQMTAALAAQYELSRSNDEEDKKRLKRLETSEKLWTSISKSSKSMASSMLEIGRGILKWGAWIGGLATGASLFGLDRMAHAASDQRRSAMGLGISVGEQKAFSQSFGRFVDTGSLLSGVSTAAGDITKQWPLRMLGINPNGGDVATESVEVLKKARELTQSTPENLWGPLLLSAKHLSDYGLDTESLRRLHNASPGEFDRQLAEYRSSIASQNIDNGTLEGWQRFVQKMEQAGQEIFKVFVQGLAPLEGPLENLSNSLVKLLQRVSDNGEVSKGIDNFAHWIDSLSGKIANPEFLAKIDAFVTHVGDFAESAGNFLGFAAHPIDNIGEYWKNVMADTNHEDFLNNVIKAQANQFGVPWQVLAAQWRQESGGALGGIIRSKKGAMGVMGLMPGTAKDLGVDNPDDPMQSVYGGAKYLSQLIRKYKGDVSEALAAYNWGQGNLDADIAKYKGDWMSHLPDETKKYIIDITKNAGLPGTLNNNLTVTINNRSDNTTAHVALSQQAVGQ